MKSFSHDKTTCDQGSRKMVQYSTAAASSSPEPLLRTSQERGFQESGFGWAILAITWLLSAIYVGIYLRQGWVPYDAGTLAQEALRTLHGQVPYRDFIEVYTGGLTYLNALAFRLFGVNLFSLRIPLFLFFLGWVPSLYFIARRFVGPIAAAGVTLLAVAWSVPNYPEAMPSWYNLFFATWGVVALLRFIESEEKRWVWVAGLCGGLSFVVKISGLYFIAASLLFLVFHELSLSWSSASAPRHRALAYKGFVSAGLLLFLAVLTNLILERPTAIYLFHFVFPSSCLVALLLRRVWSPSDLGNGQRFQRLFGLILSFVGGVAGPIVVYVGFLKNEHAMGAWWRGIVGSSVHMRWVVRSPLSPLLVVGLAPIGIALLVTYWPKLGTKRGAGFMAALILAALLILARLSFAVYVELGQSLPLLVPILAVMVFLRLRRERPVAEGQRMFLVVSVAVVCGLIQFPLALPAYLCYIGPLIILGIVGTLSGLKNHGHLATGAVVLFYLAFAVWLRTPGFYSTMVLTPNQPYSWRALVLPRAGGLSVKPRQAEEYDQLIPVIDTHAGGRYIYCAPDCPEVYFLSGKNNPTRTINEYLDPDFLDVSERTDRILAALEFHNVNLVVVKRVHGWSLSGPMAAGLRAALAVRYPMHETVGDFEVRWKPPGGPVPARTRSFEEGQPSDPRSVQVQQAENVYLLRARFRSLTSSGNVASSSSQP